MQQPDACALATAFRVALHSRVHLSLSEGYQLLPVSCPIEPWSAVGSALVSCRFSPGQVQLVSKRCHGFPSRLKEFQP